MNPIHDPRVDYRRRHSLYRVGAFAVSCIVLILVALVTTRCNRQDEVRAPDPPLATETQPSRVQEPQVPQAPPPAESQDSTTPAVQVDDNPPLSDAEVTSAVEQPPATEAIWEGPVTFSQADKLYAAGEYKDAVRAFVAYTDQNPENVWGYYMLGLAHRALGATGAAEDALRRALQLNPEHFKSHINLARVLLDDGRPVEAEHHASLAVELDPTAGVAHRILGRAYHEQGMKQDAIQAYQAALACNDRDVWAMNNLGLIRIEENRHSDALRPLARAVQLRDDVAVFYNNLGAALERTGQLRAAEDAYRRAVALDTLAQKAATSLARVERLSEEAGLQPVDLLVLAERFVAEELAAAPVAPDTVSTDESSFAGDLIDDRPAPAR